MGTEACEYLAEFPDDLSPRDLEDHTCLKENMETIFIKWRDGPPGIPALGSWDPLSVGLVELRRTKEKPTTLNANLENIIIKGFSDGTVKEAFYDHKQSIVKIVFDFPKLNFELEYDLQDDEPDDLDGAGEAYFETDVESMVLELTVKPRLAFGQTFADVQHANVTFPLSENFGFKLTNVYEGDDDFGEIAKSGGFDENWRLFQNNLKPGFEQGLAEILLNRTKTIFDYVPFTYLIKNYE